MRTKTLRKMIDEELAGKGISMTKKISSGGFFSSSTWDNRKAYSLQEVSKLIKEGFSVESNIGAILWNAFIKN